MKAFLFGGDSNGTVIDIEDYRKAISMPKTMQYLSYGVDSQHPFDLVQGVEHYIKYDEVFRKNTSAYSALEMEDLGIFIHESFTKQEIESLSKIILMVIRAQWKPVK